MKVCYLISYYSPNYVRGESILEALEGIDDVEVFVAKNESLGFKKYFETLKEFFKIRFNQNPDIYIIGFRGLEIWPIIRIFTIGKTLILDELMSPFDSLHNDKRDGFVAWLLSFILYPLEFIIYNFSNLILTDTNLHSEFYHETFKVPYKRLKQLYVSSPDFDTNSSSKIKTPLNIFFYGNFHPLHGVDVIAETMSMTKDLPVIYTIVGGKKGERFDAFMQKLKDNNVKNFTHIEWLDWDDLVKEASKSDLCLGGPFGNTSQSQKIITGKTFQFLSLAKTTIVGEIDEDDGFIDKKNCLLVHQGRSNEIVEAITWAIENNDKLEDIGKEGNRLFEERFSITQNSKKLAQLFTEIYGEQN